MFCNCFISSSTIKIFSSMFFILSFPLFLILSKEKNSKPFPIYCFSVIFIKLLVQQTIGIYCFVTLEKNNK
ncbi:MAG: glycosyl transferase family 2 [Granulicatella sp.]|nr:MAG: glycosyl transferase family 2 [Granulicatella sp.]